MGRPTGHPSPKPLGPVSVVVDLEIDRQVVVELANLFANPIEMNRVVRRNTCKHQKVR